MTGIDPAHVANITTLALDIHRALTTIGVTSEQDAKQLTPEDWDLMVHQVHRQRGTAPRPVSESVKAAVLAIYHDRDRHPHPFDGFPQGGQ